MKTIFLVCFLSSAPAHALDTADLKAPPVLISLATTENPKAPATKATPKAAIAAKTSPATTKSTKPDPEMLGAERDHYLAKIEKSCIKSSARGSKSQEPTCKCISRNLGKTLKNKELDLLSKFYNNESSVKEEIKKEANAPLLDKDQKISEGCAKDPTQYAYKAETEEAVESEEEESNE